MFMIHSGFVIFKTFFISMANINLFLERWKRSTATIPSKLNPRRNV